MTTKWSIDKSHSEVFFKVKHMVISTVTGEFTEFDGSVESDSDDFSNAEFQFSVEIESINTKMKDRDNHLKSADFFDSAQYPKLSFKSTSGLQNGKISGNLTIRDVTKEIILDADFGGIIKDPWGNRRAGFELSGKINRKDFGLNWSQLTEAGGMVVANDVKLLVNLEFVAQ
ncbi:YceI family protein [Apibacter raozihei]|uniref:YceI family protein n=1 Tax=Apibacter TaxID=1778601 RepID=UPI000FE2B30E|nr:MULTISPECIES: YceI family protein [Apibacter]